MTGRDRDDQSSLRRIEVGTHCDSLELLPAFAGVGRLRRSRILRMRLLYGCQAFSATRRSAIAMAIAPCAT